MALKHIGKVTWEKIAYPDPLGNRDYVKVGKYYFSDYISSYFSSYIENLKYEDNTEPHLIRCTVEIEKCGQLEKLSDDNFYLYKSNIYTFTPSDSHSNEEQKLLIEQFHLKKQAKFAKIKKEIELFKKLEKVDLQVSKRDPIPEEVRFTVWRRDEGRCVQCGSKENLEYDHIIPHSKGGSNTERNLQLLCEKCNRSKSAKI